MHLRRLNLRSFRNYSSADLELFPGTIIILGDNGAGKSNLLEAVQYVLSGRSFRTSREAEMVMSGEERFRVEAEIDNGGLMLRRSVTFEPGSGASVDGGGGPRWLAPGSVLCFSPDDLQLIKGPPAARRRFLDDAISALHPAHLALITDYQKVLSQRNSFLKRARAGLLPLADITPWDRQLAQLAVKIHEERDSYCGRLSPLFAEACAGISGEDEEAVIIYRSQIGDVPEPQREARLLSALAEAWQKDMERLSTSVGAHRDDVEFQLGGKSLRPYGSQGQQRTAVLAILLASRNLKSPPGGRRPLLLLDDVMSELDPDRRRRLMQAIKPGAEKCQDELFSLQQGGGEPYVRTQGGGEDPPLPQTIITAADRSLFTDEELEAACVLGVMAGSVEDMGVVSGV